MAGLGGKTLIKPFSATLADFQAFVSSLSPYTWYRMDDASLPMGNWGSSGGSLNTASGATYQQLMGTVQSVDLTGSGSSQISGSGGPGLATDAAFAIFMVVKPDTLSVAQADALIHTSNGANNFDFGAHLRLGSNGQLVSWVARSGSLRNGAFSSAGLMSAGNVYALGLTYSGTDIRLFCNGVLVGQQAYSSGVAHTGTTTIGFMGGSDGSSGGIFERFDGKVNNVILFQSNLSDANHAQLSSRILPLVA